MGNDIRAKARSFAGGAAPVLRGIGKGVSIGSPLLMALGPEMAPIVAAGEVAGGLFSSAGEIADLIAAPDEELDVGKIISKGKKAVKKIPRKFEKKKERLKKQTEGGAGGLGQVIRKLTRPERANPFEGDRLRPEFA